MLDKWYDQMVVSYYGMCNSNEHNAQSHFNSFACFDFHLERPVFFNWSGASTHAFKTAAAREKTTMAAAVIESQSHLLLLY